MKLSVNLNQIAMHHKRFFLLLLIATIPLYLFGQSLNKSDSIKRNKYLALAKSKLVSSPDSSRNIAFEMFEFSKSRKDLWGMAQGYILIGATLHRQGKFDSAIYYFDSALKINDTLKDSLQIAQSKLNKGMCYVSTGAYQKGAENTLASLKILEQLKDESIIARKTYLRCFNIMGQVYYYQSDFIKTKDYFERYLEEAIKAKDTLSIASANNNLGAVYYELKDYDKALEHDLKGAEIHKQLNNSMGYANSLQNIATGLREREEYDKALVYYKQAKDLYEEVPNEKGVSEVLFNYGAMYSEMGNLSLSIKHYLDAIELSKKINNHDVLKRCYSGLSKVYVKKNEYKSALEFHKRFHNLSDSLVNLKNLNKTNELEITYETEKKEQQIVLLSKDKELQASTIENNRISIIALIIFIVSAFILAVWLFKRTQYKQRLKFETEKAKSKEEQVIAVINSQEKERKRFAMDLHDDFGQLLSAMKLNVHSMKGISDNEKMKKSETLLDNMYSSLKNIAFDLMPHTLFEKGLEEALDELKDQINSSEQLRLDVQSFGIKNKIESDQKIALYRIIQELMSNVIKYSNAQKVNISITDHGDGLTLMIEDDGLGYDFNTFKNGKGNGWKNIQSRLGLLSGEIEIDTMKGRKNTTVALDIPYSIKEETVAA
jgi:two-component system NarL family sensor kinase